MNGYYKGKKCYSIEMNEEKVNDTVKYFNINKTLFKEITVEDIFNYLKYNKTLSKNKNYNNLIIILGPKKIFKDDKCLLYFEAIPR